MTIHTATDLTGGDAKVQLSSTAGAQARSLWLTAISGTARFGDANVSSTRGVQLAAGVEYVFAASDADATDTMDLGQAYVYVPQGTTVTITWGV